MSKHIYILLVCMACLLMPPVPVSADNQFDGEYVGTTTFLDMQVPTTMTITNSQLDGLGMLDTKRTATSGSWGESTSLSAMVYIHFGIKINGRVAGNGVVTGTVEGTSSMQADNVMEAEYNNQFSGTIKNDVFSCSPTITLKVMRCEGMTCKDNQSGTINIQLTRKDTRQSPKANQAPGPLVDSLPVPSEEPTASVTSDASGPIYISAGPWDVPPSQQKWIILKGKQPLYKGWLVRTGPGAEAKIMYGGLVIQRLGQNTWFESKQLGMPETPTLETYGRLIEGIMEFYHQKQKEENKKFEVETERAICTIRGTTFVLEATKTQTTLKVIDGTVEYTSKVTGQTASVSAGQMMAATDSGLGKLSTFDVSAEQAKWGPMPSDTGLIGSGSSAGTSTAPSTKKPGLALPKCPFTAALQVDPASPRLTIFRNFRDRVLLRSEIGRAIVTFYYGYGTWVVDNLLNSDVSCSLTRAAVVEPLSLALNRSAFLWNN